MSEAPEQSMGGHVAREGIMDGAEIQRRAIAGTLWTGFHVLLSIPLAFGVNAIVARLLGPGSYGTVAVLTLVLGLASQTTHLGVSDATLQWGAVAAAQGNRGEVRQILSKSLGFHIFIQLPLLLATVLIMAWGRWWICAVLAISMVFSTAFGSAVLLMSIENRTAQGAKLAMVSNLAVQGSLLLSATTRSAAWVWAARVLSTALAVPFSLLLVDSWGRRTAFSITWPRKLPKGFWRFGTFTMLGGLAATLVFSRSEILVLTWFDQGDAAGLFALAFGLASQITAPVDAVVGPLGPAASALVSAHPHRAVLGRRRAVRVTSLVSGGIMSTIVPFLAPVLALIYGSDYAGVEVVFFALAAVSCLQSVCNPFVVFQRARRKAERLLFVTMAALLVNFGLAVALIPSQGLVGALVANAAGQLTYIVILVAMESRDSGDAVTAIFTEARAYIAGVCSSLVGYIGVMLTGIHGWTAAPLSLLLGLSCFLMLVRSFHCGLLASDWNAIVPALPRRLVRFLQPFSKVLVTH